MMAYFENKDEELELATKFAQNLPIESLLMAITLQLGKTQLRLSEQYFFAALRTNSSFIDIN